MKRFSSILIAAISLACVTNTIAATHPHYGGTLRVGVQTSAQTFDPTISATPGLRSLTQLVFETLVKLDDRGRPQPLLAASWQVEPGNQRWRFQLRNGVVFSDGVPVDSSVAAASIRAANPDWKIFALGELIMIETSSPVPNLAAELALPRNSISRRVQGALIGTGPFTVAQFDATKQHLTLQANDQYWGGRPYIDSIEADMGKNDRDQLMLMDLGKNDLVEVAPEDIRRAQTGNHLVKASQPAELLALYFSRDARSDDELHLRNALALSIDSAALNTVLFQSAGEPTGALLPNWFSGYGFIFPAGGFASRSRAPHSVVWTLSCDSSDPSARIAADRIALNAKDAGITLQLVNSDNPDIKLVKIALPSADSETALDELARDFQLPAPAFANSSVSTLYSAETALLQTRRVVPIVYLRTAVAFRSNVHGLKSLADGSWQLGNVWLSAETP
ncbi:MAG TPA: ABC transporter substrate-binding protein [Terriglobales bacterium]|jgi:peptide/nickel transport system substrate-binding protein|nr:ABC transporter substrate-binding protein [Terriglobales bacterium]